MGSNYPSKIEKQEPNTGIFERLMQTARFTLPEPFTTESGVVLSELELFYSTEGVFIPGQSKVAWVCHALTANSNCVEWWPELIGKDKAINAEDYFIICVNIPSSCYGSTGPHSVNPDTGEMYFAQFPFFTVRDIVNAFVELRKHLGIQSIDLLIGGSMGGYQCVEWEIIEPSLIKQLVLVATSAKESAWGIAIHTAQRLAIESDETFGDAYVMAGARGLKTARAIGMLTYRNYEAFVQTQSEEDDRIDNFKAASYINYQGDKLVNRFNAYSYWLLTKTMDSHNVARGRGEMRDVLKQVIARTLCIGISSDILCPVAEQKFLGENIPNATFVEIDSPFGHDGFLVEGAKIGSLLRDWKTN